MFAVVGTVPAQDFPLTGGPVSFSGQSLMIDGHSVPVNRGTPALLASALKICGFFGAPPPFAYLAGDIGTGAGSRKLYAHLETDLPSRRFDGLTFHYIQPDVDWHNRVMLAIEKMVSRPILIADAGFMYAAKMSGYADFYDVFTPDAGELAFLADESAPHPFYTRGFIFHESNRVPELIARAYRHGNAARYLLVKGEADVLADAGGIRQTIAEPLVPALEPIGGTGDILTGLLTALIGMGHDIPAACCYAARISRMAGELAQPDPGTQVIDIIARIPESAALIFASEKQ
ncbi:MAG: NAD(P)H-hydrate dehydratase [Thermodesulfobacteriota bacterium]